MKFIFFIGRLLFSAIFIIKSFDHFFPSTINHATNMGVPAASFWVPVWGILALLGGLSILFGFKARFGAWLLVIFLIPTTFFMHNFWKEVNPYETMMQQYCFWKNLSMLGAALMISYFGSGPCSIDKK